MAPPAIKMRHLSDFAAKAYCDAFEPSTAFKTPFKDQTSKDAPLVRPKGVNRILLYPGSFNPPHQGHMTLLDHVYNNGGDDLQLIAAIVLPTSDRRLAAKTYTEDHPLILPQKQRVELWRRSGELTNRMWVFDRDEKDWAIFRVNLESEFRKADLNIKFVVLTGPDYVARSTTTDPTYWDCKDTITSDISRPVDFVTATGSLTKVYPCSDWTYPRWDAERFLGQFKAKMRGQPMRNIEHAMKGAAVRMQSIRVCHRLLKPKGTIRFVWTGRSAPAGAAPSSTKIRQVLESGSDVEIEQHLVGVALSPLLLAKYVKEYVQDVELQKLQVKLREQAAVKAERDWKDEIAW